MKKSLWIIFLFLTLQAVFGIVTTQLASFLSETYCLSSEQSANLSTWLLGASLFLSNISIFIIVRTMMRTTRNKAQDNRKNSRKAETAIFVFATLISINFFVNSLSELLNVPDLLKSNWQSILNNPLCLITIVIIGPIAEETCFRQGILGSLLATESLKHYALIISSLIFGLIHLNPAQMTGAFILGLFFGWLYLRTHSLLFPILCHIFNNGLSVSLSMIFGTDMKISGFFPCMSLFYIAILISAALSILFFKMLKSQMNIIHQK